MKINCLDASVYNRIAAGEVVENPASIVKELVENSIDAGATEITVSIEDGGIKRIEIADNGCGIPMEELPKAILPHATSKIATAEDLDTVGTLGFRGEALASIAAVSEIEIRTCYFEENTGAILHARGGDATVADCAHGKGTSITVSNLFFNTPARFKFLKSKKTEESYITKLISQLILANPDTAIRYFADGKQIFASDGQGLSSAVSAVFLFHVAKHLLPLEPDPDSTIKVGGYCSDPGVSKGNRNDQTVILNGRIISDPMISGTVQNAYGQRLMSRTFPVFVLDIVMPFDEVDVNVHPNKKEVRFANPRKVYSAIYQAVKGAIERYEQREAEEILSPKSPDSQQSRDPQPDQNPIKQSPRPQTDLSYRTPPSDRTASATPKASSDSAARQKIAEILASISDTTNKLNDAGRGSVLTDYLYGKQTSEPNGFADTRTDRNAAERPQSKQSSATPVISGPTRTVNVEAQETIHPEDCPDYRIVGQLFQTYWVVEENSRVILIDQHAAHERVLYDRLSDEVASGTVAVQPLLIPYIYESTVAEVEQLLQYRSDLEQIGFQIEPFGEASLRISAVPAILSGLDYDRFFAETASDLAVGKSVSLGSEFKEKLMQSACKAAIKGGDSFSAAEIDRFMSAFRKQSMPLRCPHGRPTYVVLTRAELEKMFKRRV